MNFIELFFLAAGLSADAFAASICKGLVSGKDSTGNAVKAGLWFGGFQALMPVAGWFLGSKFNKYVTGYDHWIIFTLLILIGGSMVRESFSRKEKAKECGTGCDMSAKSMFPLAVATSLDALAVGITFSLLDTPIITSSLFIG
ncbi:MAG: manganese efflux pump MntP family protein, partial [Eubacteriales bacterium]|nr:manganese efflux pump MntP family protein [Eubacteriales bacterium]